MNDADHVRAIRCAVLAIQDAEKALEPLYRALEDAEKAAKDAGLRITYPRTDDRDTQQPRISRETVY